MKTVIPPREYYTQALACVEHAVRECGQVYWMGRVREALTAAPPELRRLTAAILVHARWAGAPWWSATTGVCAGCVGEDLGFWPCDIRSYGDTSVKNYCPVRGRGRTKGRVVDPPCVPRARSLTFADIRREARAAGLRW